MEVSGYALINRLTTTGVSPLNISEEFEGKICRILEIGQGGQFLLINNKATGIATFEKEDINMFFECKEELGIPVPHDMPKVDRIAMASVVSNRVDDVDFAAKMIIAQSLQTGKLELDFILNPKK